MKLGKMSYIPCVIVFVLLFPFSVSAHNHENFLQCLSPQFQNSTSNIAELIYTPNDRSYFIVLNSSIQNQRFASPSFPKPLLIITPTKASHVQATVYCSRKHGFEIRTRSGGHDFEGLSYMADVPFVIIDLIKLSSVTVDLDSRTAWVQAGATLGEVYYRISEKSLNLGFPAGTCHTVGVGGLFSGGGYGMLMRKYGLAADNVIDANIVDVEGRVLDRKSMGEDLFWAIRGGGAASFGVVLSWKIRLVHVPSTVTVVNVTKNLEQKETMKLVQRWQYAANKFDANFSLTVMFQTVNTSTPQGNNKVTLQVLFGGLFLGGAEKLIPLVLTSVPELGLVREDYTEMSWIESVLYFAGFPRGRSPQALLDKTPQLPRVNLPFKGKSDYVRKPIPKKALQIMLRRLYEVEVGMAFYQFVAYGGKMSEISENEIPFPHRRGNLFHIFYAIFWEKEDSVEQPWKQLSWIRSVYGYMAPYVSKNPRAAYFNYRDLDIGTGSTSYAQASIWGRKYFKNNFEGLVHVKTKVDPTNFFKNEQSIPPLTTEGKCDDRP